MIGGTGLLGFESAKELIERGHEGFVFAAGVDERVEGPAPIYDMFYKYNIEPLNRMLKLAKKAGIKHAVILGSYFAYFDRAKPEWKLASRHPYIRSRVKQVGQCVAGALERNTGGNNYPVGYYNMTWKELISIFHKYMDLPNRKILTIPTWIYRVACKDIEKQQKNKGHEGGLKMVEFADVMTAETYNDKQIIVTQLGVTDDDIHGAIGDSVGLCLDILDGREKAIDMKGE